MIKLASRLFALLIEPGALDEEDRRRELALNVLLVVSLVLALLPAIQRAVQISQGGPETSDHFHTLVAAALAAAAFGWLLWLSRRRSPVAAAWSLLVVYYALTVWSAVAEGPGKSTTILVCALFIVAAAVLSGGRPAALAALLVSATLMLVAGLDSLHVLTAPRESSPAVPDTVGIVEIAVALGAMALLLAARTRERAASVAELVGAAPLRELRSGALTVRELQVVRLVALGRTDAEISRELVVSVRTVHSHVSSALRKTDCANRTELAVLALHEGLTDPEQAPKDQIPAHLPR